MLIIILHNKMSSLNFIDTIWSLDSSKINVIYAICFRVNAYECQCNEITPIIIIHQAFVILALSRKMLRISLRKQLWMDG